jgi:outer membrane protein assembly factor BamA
MDYYGDGPESRLADEARYRLEDSWIGASIGVRPAGPLSLGIEAGMLFVNTGDGSAGAGEGPGIGEVFDPVAVPGALIQTDFFRGAVFARYDDRDDSLGARDGGRYTARFSYFDDRHLGAHDFRQLDLEARRYLPFFNKRRVFVLRLKTAMTFANGSAAVPFYLQPVLGGSDDLRGYLPFRFYGDNLIVGNIEYRWESFSGLDMAVFFDAGKVAPTPSEIDFRGMETSVGFGFRFNVRNATFIRLDTGFSHEGTQFWFKFADPF